MYYNNKRIIHGGDYNPDQWIYDKDILDEDIRLMKLAQINSVTLGIFSWTKLEPQEGVFDFDWLDKIIDKLYKNGIEVILSTPSGARPAWLAQKYPQVLRVDENGIRNEYGVRHNHCLTSPIYREKVRIINRKLAERYKDNPAIKMWHVSNEYSGECHCPLCQNAFRQWLKEYFHNDLDLLNLKCWNGFWNHTITDWEQINSPKSRGDSHSSTMKLCWDRFITDSHISFFENEAAPLRELSANIPLTTNFMRLYDGINYQKFAKHLDIVSWDNYPDWDTGNNLEAACETAFCHDAFRSMKNGKPFYMMESSPSLVNWHDVNKLPGPKMQTLTAVQAIAHGSDSVQYFQLRKSRGGHEKFHGAVIDHSASENARVFKEVAKTGHLLSKLDKVASSRCNADIAIVCDWENSRATKHFCGYNNKRRDYFSECIKWYKPFWEKGISADVISLDDDFSKYKLIAAPFLYMLKDDTQEKIKNFVCNGGIFIATYLTGVVDKDDLCYLGGLPANDLKDVFGITCHETDAIPESITSYAMFGSKEYKIDHICDIISSNGAKILGEYKSDFYSGTPCVTENSFGKGKAYYVAFRNDNDLVDDFCRKCIDDNNILPDAHIDAPDHVIIKKRGEIIFILNFSHKCRNISLDREYINFLTGQKISGCIQIEGNDFLILTLEK